MDNPDWAYDDQAIVAGEFLLRGGSEYGASNTGMVLDYNSEFFFSTHESIDKLKFDSNANAFFIDEPGHKAPPA